ncbi:hypothetical protein GTP46_15410 [Duganella sp. FT135W]|uniref:Uncharacterized protein n=1 Tax=Duganella flavida TaxID=2692175 RepID=A0A6L8KCR7_9BURK|nr:hypothetical protein [Duganella flavida]MYM24038.1 hypothetical protein [Duganella flavida]
MHDLDELQQCGAAANLKWLGVSATLKPDEVMRILQDVACCTPGSSITFDYALATFQPQMLEHMLSQFGFRHIEHGDAAAGLGLIKATV